MVTLREYLYGPWQESTRGDKLGLSAWVNLILSISESIEQHVLDASRDVDLRDRLRALKVVFASANGQDELWQAAGEFSALIRICQDRVAQTARAHRQDVYRILMTLSEALLLLAAGSTRTVGRLKQLEVSLERATSLNDMASLKSTLADLLALVREEARQERTASQRERNALEQQVKQIRTETAWLRSDLPGREEAVTMLERLSQSTSPPEFPQFCVVVFVLGRLKEIIRRYGDSSANDLVAELVHKRINFPERDPIAFRWSAETVLICLRWTDGLEKLNALIEPQIGNPFEHRIFLGARVAVLRVGLHWVVLPVRTPAVSLVDAIDRFAGGHA
jgi:hypothetical protein